MNLQAEGNGAQEPLVFCKECGNNVHKQCFERWTNSKKAAGVPITCVLCRAPWHMVPADPGVGARLKARLTCRNALGSILSHQIHMALYALYQLLVK